jgi:prepilin-type N-terminal cleavage/methylation domain-containing protein
MFSGILRKLIVLGRFRGKRINGFTLLELLVALIMASIIVSSLLTFVVSILDTDRKERAKVEAQEESQLALNYIADDIQEAIYIYDADGMYLTTVGSGNSAPTNRIVEQIPSAVSTPAYTDRTPILMFWKRYRYDKNTDVTTSSGAVKKVGCLEYPDNGATCNYTDPISGLVTPKGRDQYVYSLVVYYLVKDSNATWSNTSRIARWELRDGIRWSCVDQTTAAQNNGALCPTADYLQRIGDVPISGINYNADSNRYLVKPDPGFLRFDVSGAGTLTDRLNRWKIGTTAPNPNTSRYLTLIDYVDDTTYVASQDNGSAGPIQIGLRPNSPIATGSYPTAPGGGSRNYTSCDRADIGVGVGLKDVDINTATQTIYSQRIPPDFGSTTYNPTGLSSFYACVNPSRVTARVYIRGNALARLEPNKNFRTITDDKRASYVPTANVRVFGRGALSLE